ncbi:MAG: DUF3667 domain-containing protein [Cyclobacteriaceae bacterium]|jgi:hypothetical protein|nr:DUF3667 domain-containing protein [Cyclobacteriaceae bacterium]
MLESSESEALNLIPMGVPLPAVSGNCQNCGTSIRGKFCTECGQRTTVKRLTWRDGWNDFWSRVYGFDGMFPRTLRDLTLRPGKAAREYINGVRVKYYGPVGYLFLMVTLFLLVASMLGISMAEFFGSQQAGMGMEQSEGQAKFNKMLFEAISENMRLFSFCLIPFITLMAMLFFRKSKLNFLEHSVMPLYLSGHIYWLSIITLFVFKITGQLYQLNMLGLLASLLMFGFGYSQLISYQGKVKAFIKGVLAYLFGYLLFVIFFTVLTMVIVFTRPEFRELLVSPAKP